VASRDVGVSDFNSLTYGTTVMLSHGLSRRSAVSSASTGGAPTRPGRPESPRVEHVPRPRQVARRIGRSMTTSAIVRLPRGRDEGLRSALLPWRMPEHRAELAIRLPSPPVPHAACDARRARRRIVDGGARADPGRGRTRGATIRSPPIFRRASSSHDVAAAKRLRHSVDYEPG